MTTKEIKPPSRTTDPSEMQFLALDLTSPYVAEYNGNVGKTANYILRWVRTIEENEPWSKTVIATIVGKLAKGRFLSLALGDSYPPLGRSQ